MLGLILSLLATQTTIRVDSVNGLRQALAVAKAGTAIVIAPGTYAGGIFVENLHGSLERKIVIRGADPANPPKFTSWQLSQVSHLEIGHLVLEGATSNGLNVDDGGKSPSHHVRIHDVVVRDLPQGNHDGIKLSGLDDFVVERCLVERWGGSGVDMVGCHRGLIDHCTFRDGGDSGVQAKGGSEGVIVRACRFERPGHRGVNLGGSTGMPYFRPLGARYEAKNLTVEGSTFIGGVAAVAFVGVDGAVVRFNTIYRPERWALRILQETTAEGFVQCRNGRFEDNLVVFRSDAWASGGVNVGGNTQPETFRFERNFWFCEDRPSASRPQLPTPESNGVMGQDPVFADPARGDLKVPATSPASKVGAHAFALAR